MDDVNRRRSAPIRKKKYVFKISNLILILSCIAGVIFLCIFLNMMANETETELNMPPTPIPTKITTIPTPVPTVTKSITVQPTTVPTANITVNKTATPVPIETIYVTSEKSILLNYTYNSNTYRMSVPLDDKLARIYNTKKPTYVCTKYGGDNTSCTLQENETYYKTYITDTYQDGVLNDIVNTITNQSNIPDDQARIAISIVQQIPYDTNKSINILNSTMRYPYMVIYDGKGICSEKSMLLASLLQRLGFGVILYHFESEKHMAVGIKSPYPYSYKETGYAFIETTVPSIPTDSGGNYSHFGKLVSMPFIYTISYGRSMNSIGFEYNDNIEYTSIINNKGTDIPVEEYEQWQKINKKYGMGIE